MPNKEVVANRDEEEDELILDEVILDEVEDEEIEEEIIEAVISYRELAEFFQKIIQIFWYCVVQCVFRFGVYFPTVFVNLSRPVFTIDKALNDIFTVAGTADAECATWIYIFSKS